MSNSQARSPMVSKTIASQMAAKNTSTSKQQATKPSVSASRTATSAYQRKRNPNKKMDYSKQIIHDIRGLLWVVTIGSLLLAFYCVRKDFVGALPWISALVGLPWTAHATISSFYFNMAKSDHKVGGISYDAAKASNFGVPVDITAASYAATNTGSVNSPSI